MIKISALDHRRQALVVALKGDVGGAKFSVMEPMRLLPQIVNMKGMDDVRKLCLKFRDVTNLKFLVALTPLKKCEAKPGYVREFKELETWNK